MNLRFMPAALEHWDEVLGEQPETDSLVLSFFSDERPLHGVAGLADWRLCGRLSRLIMKGHCSGKRGDSVMMPAGHRLPFKKVFLFGLGPGKRMDEELFLTHASWMRDVLGRAGVSQYALQAPGRATGLIGARRAAELWRDQGEAANEEVTLIDTPGAHKEMGDILAAS